MANVRPVSFPLTTLIFTLFSQDTTFAQRDMLSLHRQYLVHVSLIACDDLETYKRRAQAHLSSWLEAIHGKKNQTCIIIQVTSHSGDVLSGSRSTPISRAELVFEQMNADFGSKHATRIIQLRLKDRKDESWSQTIEMLADAIYWSFWSQAGALAEDIRRLEAQKELPGWNFATFFAIKESLALVFKNASLFEEALAIYDQLLELFLSAVYSANGTEWTCDGGRLDMDLVEECLASESTTPSRLESLRQSIAKGSSNLYDFFIYTFCNRVSLLASLGNGTGIIFSALELSTRVSGSTSQAAQWKFELATLVLSLADTIASKKKQSDTCQYGKARRMLALMARQQLASLLSQLTPLFTASESFFALQHLSSLGFDLGVIAASDLAVNVFDAGSWESVQGDRSAILSVYKTLTLMAKDSLRASDRLEALIDFDMAMVHLLQGENEIARSIADTLIENPLYADWSLIRKQLYLLKAICSFKLGDYEGALRDTLESWHPRTAGLVGRLEKIGQLCKGTLTIPTEPLVTCTIRGTLVTEEKMCLQLEVFWGVGEEASFDSIVLSMASDRMDCQFRAEGALKFPSLGTRSIELSPLVKLYGIISKINFRVVSSPSWILYAC